MRWDDGNDADARSAVSQHTRDTRRERFRNWRGGGNEKNETPSSRNTVLPLVFFTRFFSFTPSAADVCAPGINHTRVKHM